MFVNEWILFNRLKFAIRDDALNDVKWFINRKLFNCAKFYCIITFILIFGSHCGIICFMDINKYLSLIDAIFYGV